jgi:hypothetical protein
MTNVPLGGGDFVQVSFKKEWSRLVDPPMAIAADILRGENSLPTSTGMWSSKSLYLYFFLEPILRSQVATPEL